MKILIVEDDSPLRLLIARTLRDHGFEATGVGTAAEMQALFTEGAFQLVVLDIMLPGTNGLDICRWLRARSAVPIIIISARGQETDRIVGLELGADDYLSKPFGAEELVARVRAVLRRTNNQIVPQQPARNLRFGDWRVDLDRREVFAPDGEMVPLSGAEYELLLTLTDSAQRVVSRDFLLEQSRERFSGSSDRSIDVLISRLRAKLGSNGGGQEELIRTVRGAGYMFVPAVERQ
ncbi:response regulator transcription factor [Stakelama pacifica]|uniref:Regulatory protein VirG n=1 Tax=Stakelama pacifica TaxID=517720 RepID=A0A4R6FUM5_9SPHN|nr:response regulator transcription factor [Stakelama pacifica]MAX00230.1 DNA-binding response regulator [Sphingomonas sp.]TDN84644.1 DNA-binding response OmpR family regulator [Stakelama pacifica]GGO93203.1 DNA-binding response regulator [Stakelama pacifica]